jgi:hypothetical protein
VKLPLLLLLSAIAVAQDTARSKGPLVYISGNGGVTVSTSKLGAETVTVASPADAKHDQTMQMAEELLKHCSEITLTIENAGKQDYELLLHRQQAGIGGDSQFMIVRSSDKSIIYAQQKGSVSRAMKASCNAILSDWHLQHHIAEKTPGDRDWWNVSPQGKKP